MLIAFKQQLKQLAKNHEEFVGHIRARVGREKGGHYVEPLKNLVVVMPEMIAQVHSWSNDARIPSKEKKLHGYMLTYLYHPVDFLPESGEGLFGYLDDAYFVGSIYSRTMRLMDYETRRTLPNLGPLTDSIDEWLQMAREVISPEVKKIDELIEELVHGRMDAFDRLMAQNNMASKEL
jgi:uncharacterized membrane protein YkvA (DUF1232 family)